MTDDEQQDITAKIRMQNRMITGLIMLIGDINSELWKAHAAKTQIDARRLGVEIITRMDMILKIAKIDDPATVKTATTGKA